MELFFFNFDEMELFFFSMELFFFNFGEMELFFSNFDGKEQFFLFSFYINNANAPRASAIDSVCW